MRATVLTTLALAGAALLAGTPVAPAAAQTTVDQMTCGGAIRSAAMTRRYYKRTGFGVVPIMPVFPMPAGPSAASRNGRFRRSSARETRRAA